MEIRDRRIIIGKVGGTASKTSYNYKISLPAPWIEEMGITHSDREVEIVFNGEEIIIRNKQEEI